MYVLWWKVCLVVKFVLVLACLLVVGCLFDLFLCFFCFLLVCEGLFLFCLFFLFVFFCLCFCFVLFTVCLLLFFGVFNLRKHQQSLNIYIPFISLNQRHI